MKTVLTFELSLFIILMICTQPLLAQRSSEGGLTHEAVKMTNKTVNLVKDTAITGSIYTQIALDNRLSQQNIDVSTEQGVVRLEGTVDSDTEASALIQLASSTAGVVAVDAGQLKVKKSKQPFLDMVITAKVKGTFIREKLLDDQAMLSNIHVETNNGVVYLSGRVHTTAQAQAAAKLAQTISGVKRVESAINVVNDGHL